jgi:hypothetical protein
MTPAAKLVSKMSTLPLWKSVAYKYVFPELAAMARPLYTAPEAELSAFKTALVPLFQPTMVPSSVEK